MNTKRGTKRLRTAIVEAMSPEMREEVTGLGVRHETRVITPAARHIVASNHYLVEWDRDEERHVLYLWMSSEEKHPERLAQNVLKTMQEWPSNRTAANFFAGLSKTVRGPIGITVPYSTWNIILQSKEHSPQCYRARLIATKDAITVHDTLKKDIGYTATINMLAKSFSVACQIDTLLAGQLNKRGLLEGHVARTCGLMDGIYDVSDLPIHISKNGLQQIIAAHRLGGSESGDVLYEDGNILLEGINLPQTVLAGLAGQRVSAVTGKGTKFDNELIEKARNIKIGKKPTLLLKMQSRRTTLKKAQRMYGCQEPDMPQILSLQARERYQEYVASLGEGAILSDSAAEIEKWLDRGRPVLRPPRYTEPTKR